MTYTIGSDGFLYKRHTNDSAWSKTYSLPTYEVRDIVVKDSIILVAGYGPVYLSKDYGISWNLFSQGLPATLSLTILGDQVFAATRDSGVYNTTIDGTYWSKIPNNNFIYEGRVIRNFDSVLYAGTYGAFYMSTDLGSSWKMKNDGLMPGYVNSLTEISPYVFAATGAGLFRSKDHGNTWDLLPKYPMREGISILTARNDHLYSGTGTGHMYTSSDMGDTWQTLENNLAKQPFSCLAVMDTNVFAGSTGVGIYRLNEVGTKWKLVRYGDDPNCFTVRDSVLFAGIDTIGILKSVNRGRNGQRINNGLSKHYCRALTSCGKSVFTYGLNLYMSDDDGLNWVRSDNGLPDDSLVFSLANHDSNVYAGHNNGIWVSRKGYYWGDVSNGLPSDIQVFSMQVSGQDLYTGTIHGVWRRPLSELGFLKLGNDTLKMPNRIYTTDSVFVYSSNDWSLESSLPFWLRVDKTTGFGCETMKFMIMEENYSSSTRYTNQTLTSSHAPACHLIISQEPYTGIMTSADKQINIYPNPATDQILISGLENEKMLSIEILDPSGQVILNTSKVENSDLYIDVSSIQPGLYLLKIQTATTNIVKKILVIR